MVHCFAPESCMHMHACVHMSQAKRGVIEPYSLLSRRPQKAPIYTFELATAAREWYIASRQKSTVFEVAVNIDHTCRSLRHA